MISRLRAALLVVASLAGTATPAFAQPGQGATSAPVTELKEIQEPKRGTQVWCDDATTYCWSNDPGRRAFSGIRLVFEPQLGVLVQGGDNKFDDTNFRSLEKIGVATNLFGTQLGLQVLFIYPSTVHFDEQSPVRVDRLLFDETDGKVDVEWGMTFGVAAFDGILSTGFGFLKYDRRDFKNAALQKPSAFGDSFFYLNVQAIEAVKGAIKNMRR